MIAHVNFKKLRKMPCSRGLNHQLCQLHVPMNRTYQEGCLSLLILAVGVDAAADEKSPHSLPVILASQVQGSGKLGIDEVWLGSCSLE